MMVKYLLQRIHAYCMPFNMLLDGLIDDIHSMLNDFWWSLKRDNKEGIKWLRWDKMAIRKELGWYEV